jgi:hypothetical protein
MQIIPRSCPEIASPMIQVVQSALNKRANELRDDFQKSKSLNMQRPTVNRLLGNGLSHH